MYGTSVNVTVSVLHPHLADRLDERLRFDIAHRAADLDQRYVGVVGALLDAALDLIRDMRNHLHRGAQIIAPAFLADDIFVNFTGGEIVALGHGGAHEALVMPKIQVSLGAILGDEYFAVLKRAHGARININIGVELEKGNLEAARFEDGAQ
jgi:hypothetical protein